MPSESRATLLTKVIEAVAKDGLADRSLREIAASAGTSHRMLIYHFGSREGLLTAIVEEIEARQRAAMTAMPGESPAEVMTALWERVSSSELRPFVRLFFEVFALSTRADGLTSPWLAEGAGVAERLGVQPDPAALRLGVAVSRGLLLDLLAGASKEEVDDAYALFVSRFAT
jgi:AcrR family transcriptional regulator